MNSFDFFEKNGYVIIPNVLTEEQCEEYKRISEVAYQKYSPLYATNKKKTEHGIDNKASEKVVFNLHNKHRKYIDLIDNPAVMSVVMPALQKGSYMDAEAVLYTNSAARTPLPGAGAQQLHIDSGMPGTIQAMGVQVIWFLDEFTVENGATRVVPGSHLRLTYPENGKEYAEEIRLCGPRGSVLCMNAGMWHGGGANRTAKNRWSLVYTYVRWYMRPSFDMNRNMPRELYDYMSTRQKELLGYKVNPPVDEFTRASRRSETFDVPSEYSLPGGPIDDEALNQSIPIRKNAFEEFVQSAIADTKDKKSAINESLVAEKRK